MPLGEEGVSPMKYFRLTVFVIFFIFAGCSTSAINNSTLPDNDVSEYDISGLDVSGHPCPETASNRTIIAIGTIELYPNTPVVSGDPSPETLIATFLPDREAAAHWNVTPMLMPPACADCVIIQVLEYKPAQKSVKLKVTLKNPSNFTAYDVRGIAMTNDTGVRLLNADAYTILWDDGGAVTKNPFRGFAYEVPEHIFNPKTVHSNTYDFTYQNLSGLAGAKLIVDASWPWHCLEPWDIRDQSVSGELPWNSSSSVKIECHVEDWQCDWMGVELDLSALGFDKKVTMEGSIGDYWTVIYNQHLVPPGKYRIWFATIDFKTTVRLYDDLYIIVAPSAPAPTGFKIMPGEIFAKASWDVSELDNWITHYCLYKREKGKEYDYDSPILVASEETTYMDEDVLAGHMYFYRLSAFYSPVGEGDLTEEHGGKPFKWGPPVLLSDLEGGPLGGNSMYPEIAIGPDNNAWIAWQYGYVDNFDNNQSPDWNVTDHGLLPGVFDFENQQIAAGPNGTVYLLGLYGGNARPRFIKANPFASIEYDMIVEDKYWGEYDIAVNSSGVVYILYLANLEGYPNSEEVWLRTIDLGGNVSAPTHVSDLGPIGNHKCWSNKLFIDKNDIVHCVWVRGEDYGDPGSYKGMVYRRLENGEWGPEEHVKKEGISGGQAHFSLWVDSIGTVYVARMGCMYYIRNIAGQWSGSFWVSFKSSPPGAGVYDGWMTGDNDNNLLFVISHHWGEVNYVQKYGDDFSCPDYYLTNNHYPVNPDPDALAHWSRIACGPDGLAVVTWMDTVSPSGVWEIYARKQIME